MVESKLIVANYVATEGWKTNMVGNHVATLYTILHTHFAPNIDGNDILAYGNTLVDIIGPSYS